MNYKECLEVIKNIETENKIGESITKDGVVYQIKDIVVAPAKEHRIIFLEDYVKDYKYENAISRFITRNDLTVCFFVRNNELIDYDLI